MTEAYTKFGYGLFVLKSKNSLFNADFSHEPRQLPDEESTFYATDKSLKYCIRRYVHDLEGEKEIFFWRREKKDLRPMDLKENYEYLFKKSPAQGEARGNLLSCWDVRIFGATFAEADCAVSITGPIQITYGINKVKENQKYSSQILSPFRNPKETHEEKEQRTIGSESKALESYLVFDYIINPRTLNGLERELTQSDVEMFKKALCKGVSYVNSSAKIGSESEFMLYLESGKSSTMPLLKDLVEIRNEGGVSIDLKRISELIKGYDIATVEGYYEPSFVNVKNAPEDCKCYNIHTLKAI